jgi:hypothetical protein
MQAEIREEVRAAQDMARGDIVGAAIHSMKASMAHTIGEVAGRLWSKRLEKLRPAIQRGESIYPVVRLFVPERDSYPNKRTYGMAETAIATVYCTYWGIPMSHHDALTLFNHHAHGADAGGRGGGRGKGRGRGDSSLAFCQRVFAVASKRCPVSTASASTAASAAQTAGRWTVGRLNAWLDDLSRDTAKDRTARFQLMIRQCTPLEQKWIVSIILGA